MELLIAILVIVVIFIIPNIKVVPQARSYVIERLGSYLTTWNNGLHFKIPFVDRVSNKVSLKEFAEKNPELIKKAGECKSKEEFEKFVKEKFGLFNSWATWFWVDSLSKLLLEYGKIS